MKRFSLMLGAVALFAVAAWFLFGPSGADEVIAADEITVAANESGFIIATLDGDSFDLSAHEGQVVLVNFWATWCPPCRLEIPHFVEMYSELKDEGFAIVGISLDRQGRSIVDGWLAENPVNYPIAMGEDGALFQEYQQLIPESERGGIPYSLIIDANGNVAHKIVGYRDKAQWLEMITPLMENVKI
jgi:peroxiredoxin